MTDEFDDKLARFEKLWDGVTPKGVNRTKALKFRQYMRNHVLQKFHKRRKDQWANADKGHYNHGFSSKDQFLTKDNCRKYWMGELQKDIREDPPKSQSKYPKKIERGAPRIRKNRGAPIRPYLWNPCFRSVVAAPI